MDPIHNKENSGYKSDSIFNNLKWMNSKEAAEYLRVSTNNFRTKVSRGEIPVNGRLSGRPRFLREELDRLLEASLQGNFK